MKHALIFTFALTGLMAGCDSPEPKRKPLPGQELRQQPITDQGVDGTKSRLVAAANLILKYADKHGNLPDAADSLKLRDALRPEFGSEPGFEELWISNNGKALLFYNQNIAGKPLSEVADKDKTWLMKDPVAFPPHGHVIVYCSGRVDAVVEQVQMGTPMQAN